MRCPQWASPKISICSIKEILCEGVNAQVRHHPFVYGRRCRWRTRCANAKSTMRHKKKILWTLKI